MTRTQKTILLLAFMAGSACHGTPGRAEATSISSASAPVATSTSGPPSVPTTAPAALAKLEQTHQRVHISDTAGGSESVMIALPKSWGLVANPADVTRPLFSSRVLGSVGPKGDVDGPVVTVSVTPMPFEISIDGLGRLMYEADGFDIVARQYFPGPEGLFFDIAGTRTENGREIVRRTLIRKDGNRLFTVRAQCPRSAWDAHKDNIWIANVTFRVLQPQQNERAETWLGASSKHPGFEINLPSSWKVEQAASKSTKVSGLHVRLPDADGQTLLSYLAVRCERAPAGELSALRRDAVAMLQRSGVAMQGELQSLDEITDPRSIAVRGWLGGFHGAAHMGTDEVSVTLGFIKRGELTFTFALCRPMARANPLVALRAQRTFEIARETLKSESD